MCGGASRCGRHSRDEIEHVPTEVVPGPAVVGGVAVGVVGEGGVGHAAPVGAGVGQGGDPVAGQCECEVVLGR